MRQTRRTIIAIAGKAIVNLCVLRQGTDLYDCAKITPKHKIRVLIRPLSFRTKVLAVCQCIRVVNVYFFTENRKPSGKRTLLQQLSTYLYLYYINTEIKFNLKRSFDKFVLTIRNFK